MILIDPRQRLHLQALINSASYAEGYRFVKMLLDNEQRSVLGSVLAGNYKILSNWFGNAAKINANDGSWQSIFVRSATSFAGEQVGVAISDAVFQENSDRLAIDVISKIVKKGAILHVNDVISLDVKSAVKSLNLPYWGWVGLLVMFFQYLWAALAEISMAFQMQL